MSGAAPITGAELRRLAHAVKGGGDIAQAEFEAIVMQVADQLDARPTGIEAQVCDDIVRRQAVGVHKYGTTLESNPAGLVDRLQHAYEELLDGANYLKWAMSWVSSVHPTALARPHGYAYRYPGDVLRFNHGQEVNGTRPIEAIPYWLGGTADAVDHHPSRIFRAGYRSALMAYRPDLVDAFNAEWPQDMVDSQAKSTEGVDSMGIPQACGKPLCSPGDHHPLCNLAEHEGAKSGPAVPSVESLRTANEELSGLLDRQLDRMHRETEQLRRELLAAYAAIPPDAISVPFTAESLGLAAETLVDSAFAAGLVLTIEQRPLKPFAMGHYEAVVDVREARVPAAGQEGGAA